MKFTLANLQFLIIAFAQKIYKLENFTKARADNIDVRISLLRINHVAGQSNESAVKNNASEVINQKLTSREGRVETEADFIATERHKFKKQK